MNGTISGSNLDATGEPGEPDHAGIAMPLNSIWCKWTAPANGSATFDTTGSSFDTTLAVYTGSAVNALTPVASNNDISTNDNQSRVTFDALQGVTYYVAVDGAGSAKGNYLLNWAQAAAGTSTFAAVLPYARSVTTATMATAFATIINAGAAPATACSLAKPPGFPGTFIYQTTNAANQLTGTPNTPVDIAPGVGQGFVFGITPSLDVNGAEVAVIFDCTNTPVTVNVPGLNTLLLSSSPTPVPDLIAIGATDGNTGIVKIPGPTGTGFFTAAAINIAAPGTITATVDDNGRGLPLILTICQTGPSTSECTNPPTAGPSTTTTISTNEIVTYTIFVTGTGAVVPFDPANNRLIMRLKTPDGVTRGATNVAVQTN
jgi:hypothetical protein